MKDPVIFPELLLLPDPWEPTRVNPNRFRTTPNRADGICVAQGAPEDTDIEIKV